MGLDITHYKATRKQPDPLKIWNVVTRETYRGFDAPFEHFSRYIQDVVLPEHHLSLFVPYELSDLDYTREWFRNFSIRYDIQTLPDGQDLETFVEAYIRENSLEGLLIDRSEALKWWIFTFNRPLHRTGFYVEEVGYQRKGMNTGFWTRFCTNNGVFHFTRKEDFDFALSCVDVEWDGDTPEDVELRRTLFKNDFVDAYEEGASYMAVSY